MVDASLDRLRTSVVLLVGALAVAVATLTPVAGPTRKFGLSPDVAGMVITVLTTSGGWLVGAMWPFLLPWIATIRGLLAAFGAGWTVGW